LFRDILEQIGKFFRRFFLNRLLVLGCLLLPLIAILVVRLFQLQIVRGEEYYENYVNTTKKEVSIAAMRGNIYDRNGVLLAGNKVVYNVTLTDGNYYTKSNGDFNEMILRLVELLEKYGLSPERTIPVEVGPDGEYVFSGTEAKIRRLIRDVYSKDTIEELAEEGIDAYSFDVDTVMDKLLSLYNFNVKKWPACANLSREQVLTICNIRYALSATSYTRYISTVIMGDVDEEVRAAVLESQDLLHGVNVEESVKRVYYNSECFSSVLGFVGSITQEEIDELNALGGDYIAGDVIGKEGIESAYENYLQGTKGKKTIYVNSTGMILYEEVTEEPEQGNDIYLSIDSDMTVATYNIIEQQLAGIIVNHLYEGTDYDPQVAYEKSEYLIPIRDVYFQMISNHVISMGAFTDEDASQAEKDMEARRVLRKAEVIAWIRGDMESRTGKTMSEYGEYEKAYLQYLYSYLAENGYIVSSRVDTSDEVYKAFKAGELSFPAYLLYALENGWADMSSVGDDARYNNVDSCYDFLIDIMAEEMEREYADFDELIYDELIHEDIISGCEIGLAMFRQGVLADDPLWKQRLLNGNNATAYSFVEAKISSMELLPSQIALDPCSAGLVMTDPNTGELLVCVSYPGYDSNRINDSAYYSSLLTDQSSPLYSRATQSRLAPGSTFKMITATAALEGGYLDYSETITCEGIFDKLDHPRCWIYRLENGQHGALDTVYALGQSCNCFFYECGYRFSLNSAGQYSSAQGLAVLDQYASLYGFGALTGVETTENISVLSNELPVTSAIGQGTHAFTTISLARYVTAIASSGNVYELKFLDHIEDRNGETVLTHTPKVINHLNFSERTWDLIHRGMYTVVHEGGSRANDFFLLRNDYAAKSGSAQENRLRAEHGWYVTYGPYDDIHYSMAVQIPNGYSSGNAALIAKNLYQYLEGDLPLQDILENAAFNGEVNDILD